MWVHSWIEELLPLIEELRVGCKGVCILCTNFKLAMNDCSAYAPKYLKPVNHLRKAAAKLIFMHPLFQYKDFRVSCFESHSLVQSKHVGLLLDAIVGEQQPGLDGPNNTHENYVFHKNALWTMLLRALVNP